jgi:acyl transferase domain-containing protein
MAGQLCAASPLFRERVSAWAEAFRPWLDWSLFDVLTGVPGAPGLDRVDVIQPALLAMMASLADLWRDHGVEPDAVVGHSQGEIAAAVVAGALSVADAARVVALRSQALLELSGAGGMVSVPLPEAWVRARVAESGGRLALAALNGPGSVVVSGEVPALDALIEQCAGEGVRARRVAVDYASHSAQVERTRDTMLDMLAAVRPARVRIPFYSTVDVRWLDQIGGDYWYRNLRQTVRFEPAIRDLVRLGFDRFIEVSPHPVLIRPIQRTVADAAVAVGSLRRDQGGLDQFRLSLAEAQVSGAAGAPPAVSTGR